MYTVYSKPNCSFCTQAKQLLTSKQIVFTEMVIDIGQPKEEGVTYVTASELKQRVPTAKTVPQIFHNETLVGGFMELRKYLSENAIV